MKRIPRRLFTEEFKKEAIKLVTEQNLNVAQAGRQLDIDPKSIRAWIAQAERGELKATLGATNLTTDQKPALGLMHHSDRRSQYCRAAYLALQASYGIQTSMSRKGHCWDNAPMESFFCTIKTESLHHYRFKTRETAKRIIFEYIEVFYNHIRRHAKISNKIPADFANQYYISNQIAA